MGTGDQPEPEKAAGRTGNGLGRAGRWVRGRTGRWVAAGAAVVVLGGGAAAVALHHEGEDHGDRRIAGERERDGGRDGDDRGAHHRGDRAEPGQRTNRVPAPLPSTDAADAVAKASSAVPGGKVESLSPATEQSGGRAWQAVVLGPDGVRHLVTLDGTSGTITGNTVLRG
ncbi:hypothetical protein [Streptomyces sp. CB03911]|uniref:hypothetical protein n=1 Tax=Streptomycetaceae TaxID=2062 RepID=UPI00093C8D96|nr:hypothetical protein [Streptomyces sp. CB03911]OKI12716.1 hypothetical protein A6A07_17805 [Streptomyces sp. CB03911]